MFRNPWIEEICCMALLCMYIFASIGKWIDLPGFQQQVANIYYLEAYAPAIAIVMPVLHVIAAFLLIADKTRLIGLYISLFILMGYTAFIGLNILKYFGPAPCNCVGIWHTVGWEEHYYINWALIFINVIALMAYYQRKKFGQVQGLTSGKLTVDS